MCKHEITYQYPNYEDIKKICTEIEDENGQIPAGRKFYEVQSFEKMVKLVAHLRFCNRKYLLLFRGQHNISYPGNKYAFLPSIYRDIKDLKELETRKAKLEEAVTLLKKQKAIREYLKLLTQERKDIELPLLYSIIQHHGITATPLLDLTHSLQVAYSFGVLDLATPECFVAVFAYPHLQGNDIYYTSTTEIINVPLLYYCPPRILRPYFQEAYAVGRNVIPFEIEPEDLHDQSKNLVAIIKIVNPKNAKGQNKYRFSKKYLQLKNSPKYINSVKKSIQQYVLE